MTITEEMHAGEKIIKTLKPSPWGYFWGYVAGVVWILILWELYWGLVVFLGWIGVVIILLTELSRRGTTYYVTNKRVIYEFTLLVRKITSTVYGRIQDLHTTQGIIDRIVGTGKIWINTA